MTSSPTLSISLRALAAKKPCRDKLSEWKAKWPKGKTLTAGEAVALGCDLDDLVWVASVIALKDKAVERRLRHWMADCATRALHIYEKHHPADGRPRKAILAARDFADGKIDAAARAAAGAAAGAAAWDAAWAAARDAAWAAARAAARVAAWDAARAAAWDAARAAAGAAAWAAAWDAARAAAWDAEEKWQLNRLVEWLSEDEPTPLALPAIQKPTRSCEVR